MVGVTMGALPRALRLATTVHDGPAPRLCPYQYERPPLRSACLQSSSVVGSYAVRRGSDLPFVGVIAVPNRGELAAKLKRPVAADVAF